MSWLGVPCWEWLVIAAVWALIPICYAVRRWRLRVFLVREIEQAEQTLSTQQSAVSQNPSDRRDEYELCLSCGRPKRVGYVCHACGFCGIVTAEQQSAVSNQQSLKPWRRA